MKDEWCDAHDILNCVCGGATHANPLFDPLIDPMFPPGWKPKSTLVDLCRRALELLRKHQACKSVPHQLGGHYECSSCDGFAGEDREVRPVQHAPDCALAATLRELEEVCK